MEFHCTSTRSRVEITVVVGSVAFADAKLAPQVIALAVPLSVICIIIISPFTGVPVREDVILVIACANQVILAISILSVLIAGVADCVTATSRLVTRLLVRVSVVALHTSVSLES